MIKSVFTPIFTFLLIPLTAFPLFAGIYIESETRNSMDSEILKTQTYISGTKMKILINDTYGWLMDLKTGKLLDFDLQNKSYYEMSVESMSQELDMIGAKMKIFTEMREPTEEDKLLAEELADTPEELTQFGASELPLGKEPETPFQPLMKKIRKKNKLLGYNCYLMQMDLSPTERQQIWVTDQIPFAQEALNFWKAFYRSSSASMKNFLPLKSHFEIMSRLEGFPLQRTSEIKAGSMQYREEETVTLIEDRNIKEEVFQLPLDIQKMEPIVWKQGFDQKTLEQLENHKYHPRGSEFEVTPPQAGGEEKS